MIQYLSGSWCIKGTSESTLVMDSPALLMYHDPDRSWITDPDPDHPKRTLPNKIYVYANRVKSMASFWSIITCYTIVAF